MNALADKVLHHDCLRCSKSYYEERQLRAHYAKRHAVVIPAEAELPERRQELNRLLAPTPTLAHANEDETPAGRRDLSSYIEDVYADVTRRGRMVTRRKRWLTGARLDAGGRDWAHPSVQCQECGRVEFRESGLRRHYARKHGLHFGATPLPKDERDLAEFWRLCGQPARVSRRCGLCRVVCGSGVDLAEHQMAEHVPERFKGFGCGSCRARFLLSVQLAAHVCVE